MSYGQKVNYAVGTANMLKGIVNAERKMFTQNTSQSITGAGTVNSIMDIAAGDDVNNRNGNSILSKSLNVKLAAYFPNTTGLTGAFLRHIIVKDTMNLGVLPTVGVILEANNYLAPINVDATSRFQVLVDDLICLDTSAGFTQTRAYYRKLDFHTKYFGTSTSTQYRNNLYQLLITNNPTMTVDSYTRVGFYDN